MRVTFLMYGGDLSKQTLLRRVLLYILLDTQQQSIYTPVQAL